MKFEKGKNWLNLLGSCVLLFILYWMVLPAISKFVPSDYQQNLQQQDIDATPLFYTESDKALNSYYYLRLKNID